MTPEPPTPNAGSSGSGSGGGHLDLDRLADLEEDLLASDESTAAHAHLADCLACRNRQADLRATRALLSTLPPEPMPEAVAARIDTALLSLPATTIVPRIAKRRGWRAHPTAAGLGAAATIAALVAALVVGRTSHSSGPGSGNQATSGSAGSAATSVPLPAASVSGTHYTAANVGRTVPALLHPQQSAALAPQTGPSPGPVGGGAAAKGPAAKRSAGSTSATGVPASLTRLFGSTSALDACVRAVEAGGPLVRPLAIDFATYQGAPSVLIVLPGLETGHIDAWFVGPGCGPDQENLLGYKSVAAPGSATPSSGG